VLEPASDASGESVARFLLKLVGWFGRPKGIRTLADGGSQYDNHLIDTFCHLLGFDRHVTLAYRPQANGKVERVNKEVGRHLRFICLDRRFENKWSSMLPLVQRSINTQIHEVLGVEPAQTAGAQLYIETHRSGRVRCIHLRVAGPLPLTVAACPEGSNIEVARPTACRARSGIFPDHT
jgi:transposase InsO family protein